MSNVSTWSTSASNNDSAPPNGAPEGMAPSTVNDTMREMMARTAKWWEDSQGSLVSGGTGDDYTLTTNSSYQNLVDLPALTFRADRANTGAATLQIDSLGSRDIRKIGGNALLAGDIAANDLVTVRYNPDQDRFEVGSTPARAVSFESGTKQVFYQASAPTGWTQDTSVNDRVLRVVDGSGGGTGGQWEISGLSGNVQGHALSINEIPAHGHPWNSRSSATVNSGSDGGFVTTTSGDGVTRTAHSGSPTGNTGEQIGGEGGDQEHDHDFSASHDGNWRPSHIDVIVASID